MFYIHLQNLCKQLYEKIDVVDEERYGYEDKVIKHNKDVSLNQQIRYIWNIPGVGNSQSTFHGEANVGTILVLSIGPKWICPWVPCQPDSNLILPDSNLHRNLM